MREECGKEALSPRACTSAGSGAAEVKALVLLCRCAPALRGGVIKTSPAPDDAIKLLLLLFQMGGSTTASLPWTWLTFKEDSDVCISWIFPILSFQKATRGQTCPGAAAEPVMTPLAPVLDVQITSNPHRFEINHPKLELHTF